jgi:hypothetical protein
VEQIPSLFGGGTTKNVATVEGETTVRIVSQTPKGEQVRTYRLNNGGKELEIVSKE